MAVRLTSNSAAAAAAQMTRMQQLEVATVIAGGAVLAGTALWAWGVTRDAWACYRSPLDKVVDGVKKVAQNTPKVGLTANDKPGDVGGVLKGAWTTVSNWFKNTF